MPCTLSNARARHIPVNACPTAGSCCDNGTSFSTQSVCCEDNFDQDWTPYDIRISATTTNPTYVQDQDSFAVYKVDGKSLFVKFVIVIESVSGSGSGIYQLNLPSGFRNTLDVGNILLFTTVGQTPQVPVQGMLSQLGSGSSTLLRVLIPSTIPASIFWDNTNIPITAGGVFVGDIHIRLV